MKTAAKFSFGKLPSKKIIDMHLFDDVSYIEEGQVLSTLKVMQMESAHANSLRYSENLLPLLGSFAILDQLGNSYSNSVKRRYRNPHASGIKKCLYYFADKDEDDLEIKAIYALRNALVHKCSLVAEEERHKKDRQVTALFINPAKHRYNHGV
ncbi:MAG TPA: hypothetical protein VKB53_10725 [Gammaproteobacteria bacterium]|jgi:hypothetical protein|nr:hypothetical protein [Gammaproteobacteria bacterium]